MTDKEYRECINEMLMSIDDNRVLKIIFETVHRYFMRRKRS